MLEIRRIPAALFDANCYVTWEGAAGADQPARALVVDPGPGTAKAVKELLASEGVELGAVLLTHGHIDHVWDAAAVTEGTDVSVYIPDPDLFFLEDPAGMLGYSPQDFGLPAWQMPENVTPIKEVSFSPTPDLHVRMIPAPGHSPGSAVFLFASTGADDPQAFSGDVVFAGSVGRTDLPRGDEREMQQSLRTLANSVDPATTFLPGHGPSTVWSHEVRTNPFVRRALKVG